MNYIKLNKIANRLVYQDGVATIADTHSLEWMNQYPVTTLQAKIPVEYIAAVEEVMLLNPADDTIDFISKIFFDESKTHHKSMFVNHPVSLIEDVMI